MSKHLAYFPSEVFLLVVLPYCFLAKANLPHGHFVGEKLKAYCDW